MVSLALVSAVVLRPTLTLADERSGTIAFGGGVVATSVRPSPDQRPEADAGDAEDASSTVALVGWAIVVVIGAVGAYAWWRGRKAVRQSGPT